MYAIVETGGKQVKVSLGDKIYVEKLSAKEGEEITLDKVVMIGGEKIVSGKPYVKGATVTAKVEKQGLEKKLTVYTYKSKANVRRKKGHRQPYTCLVVKSINA